MIPDVERRRRELLERDRELYAYIAARETSKALDRLGDTLSGRDHGAANIAWAEAARLHQEYEAMQA